MLQRPGCFVMVVFALLVALAVGVNAINDARGELAVTAVPIDAAQGVIEADTTTPRQSETMVPSATPDALATQAAVLQASADAANAMRAATGTAMILGTAQARTAIADAWTATAIADQVTLVAANKTEVAVSIQQLAATVTMMPTADWMTDVARWPTAQAEQTQAAYDQQANDNARGWGRLASDAWGLASVAVPVSIVLGLIASAIVIPSALSWRVQGEDGGKAQASVVAITTRAPIPTTTSGEPTAPISRYTPIEHLTMRVLGRMAHPDMSGPDATMLTSAPMYSDNRTRDKVRDALIVSGLAVSAPGVGVELVEPWTIGTLAQAIADGAITLSNPPTPTGAG